jgi:twitching motility protein PilI
VKWCRCRNSRPAPLTKPWFAGIANIRGVLYSVVDFASWRGGAPTPINAQSRLLLVGARHGINSALLVRRALGLRPQMQMHATGVGPDDGDDGSPGSADASRTRRISRWTQLRIPALLADPNYLDIAL